MQKTHVEKILAEELGRAFAADGFQYVKSAKWLARKLGDITHSISWSYYSSAPGFRVVPALAVRSDAIEAIFKQVSQVHKEDEPFRRTLGLEVWRLSGDRSRGEFKVLSLDETKEAAGHMAAFVRAEALPFLDRCKSVSDIDELFNANPNSLSARLLSLHNWSRSANALIAARLARNPKYEALVDVYRAVLANFGAGEFLKPYESLVELLSKLE